MVKIKSSVEKALTQILKRADFTAIISSEFLQLIIIYEWQYTNMA